jgi:tRNA (mo5U34)-methyltransferase
METEAQIRKLGPWFHNLHLPDGSQTEPNHPLGDFPQYKWQALSPFLPRDMTGWRALDIGCNAGFYTIELARRGAHVLAFDYDEHYLAQARWAVAHYGLDGRVNLRKMHVYDLSATKEQYDLVLFMGVFYHLRYPLLGLDIAARKVKNLMVFQSMLLPGEEVAEPTDLLGLNERWMLLEPQWPKMAFIEGFFHGDPTNWWIPNRAAVEAMLRSAGLKVLQRPEPEMFLCRKEPTLARFTHDVPTRIEF